MLQALFTCWAVLMTGPWEGGRFQCECVWCIHACGVCVCTHTYVYTHVSVTVECCGDVCSAIMPILLGLEHNFAVVAFQSLSHVQLFVTPRTAAPQASLSFTIYLPELAQTHIH